MICSCGEKIDVSDKRLLKLYLQGKKKVIIPCKKCKKQYKVRIFLKIEKFIDDIDFEQDEQNEIKEVENETN